LNESTHLGSSNISTLIAHQSIPASIGVLVMSLNMLVDTIFLGHWVGSIAIAAITVVLPITFFMSSVGMAIGIGGASIISRALGEGNVLLANHTFGNQLLLTFMVSTLFLCTGLLFSDEIVSLYGAKENVLVPSETYFSIILLGIPFLSLSMMSNNVVRALGYPKTSMNIMIYPALLNILLDPIFIYFLDWGLKGAALASTLSYIMGAFFCFFFFLKKRKQLDLSLHIVRLDFSIVKEISSIGFVSLVRQGIVSLLSIFLNNSLYRYGGEIYLSVYGIINRVMIFALFPIIGITQGFLPIAGYNYGAKKFDRVVEVIKKSILYGSLISITIYSLVIIFRHEIIHAFTDDEFVLENGHKPLLIVFLATPIILVQLIGSAYYQAIGKAFPALLLTLSKQGFFLIPLILILPIKFGLNGIWISFPLADILATILTFFFLKKGLVQLKNKIS
jgi:putative MATE family efflux protein